MSKIFQILKLSLIPTQEKRLLRVARLRAAREKGSFTRPRSMETLLKWQVPSLIGRFLRRRRAGAALRVTICHLVLQEAPGLLF